MSKKCSYALRGIVVIILLFSFTPITVTNAGQMAAAASVGAGQPFALVAYISNPFDKPGWIGESDLPGAAYGVSVASAGDVNGDGYDDVIIGAPHYANGQDREGRAYVYFGSASGVKPLPAWTFESNIVWCEIGWSVASAGDVNGDGYDDVLVSSEFCGQGPATNHREGRVYLFTGSKNGLSTSYTWMIQGGGFDESLGWSIASAGDVNNDGYDDVIIGAPWASYPQDHEGRAYVFYGSASGLSPTANWIKESNIYWSDFGISVGSAGDVNGDGYDDVIIGHAGMTNPEVREGRVYVYLGSKSGLADIPIWTFENNHPGSELGESVASAGDVNGDGFDDVLAGGFAYPDPSIRKGIAYLFFGSPTGELTPAWFMESDQEYGEYGQSVASAGDINQDGYSDILIGAPWYSSGEKFEGVAFLYYGSPAGLLSSPVFKAESNQASANLGYSVASAGDVNGDGIADVIVGALNFDGGQENEGRAMVYYGRANPAAVIFIPIIMR